MLPWRVLTVAALVQQARTETTTSASPGAHSGVENGDACLDSADQPDFNCCDTDGRCTSGHVFEESADDCCPPFNPGCGEMRFKCYYIVAPTEATTEAPTLAAGVTVLTTTNAAHSGVENPDACLDSADQPDLNCCDTDGRCTSGHVFEESADDCCSPFNPGCGEMRFKCYYIVSPTEATTLAAGGPNVTTTTGAHSGVENPDACLDSADQPDLNCCDTDGRCTSGHVFEASADDCCPPFNPGCGEMRFKCYSIVAPTHSGVENPDACLNSADQPDLNCCDTDGRCTSGHVFEESADDCCPPFNPGCGEMRFKCYYIVAPAEVSTAVPTVAPTEARVENRNACLDSAGQRDLDCCHTDGQCASGHVFEGSDEDCCLPLNPGCGETRFTCYVESTNEPTAEPTADPAADPAAPEDAHSGIYNYDACLAGDGSPDEDCCDANGACADGSVYEFSNSECCLYSRLPPGCGLYITYCYFLVSPYSFDFNTTTPAGDNGSSAGNASLEDDDLTPEDDDFDDLVLQPNHSGVENPDACVNAGNNETLSYCCHADGGCLPGYVYQEFGSCCGRLDPDCGETAFMCFYEVDPQLPTPAPTPTPPHSGVENPFGCLDAGGDALPNCCAKDGQCEDGSVYVSDGESCGCTTYDNGEVYCGGKVEFVCYYIEDPERGFSFDMNTKFWIPMICATAFVCLCCGCGAKCCRSCCGHNAHKVCEDSTKISSSVEGQDATFYLFFLKADVLRAKDTTLMPRFHDILNTGCLQPVPFSPARALSGEFRTRYCMVSHVWATVRHPDPKGVNLRIIRDHLEKHPEIMFVWCDYSCMPSDDDCMGYRGCCSRMFGDSRKEHWGRIATLRAYRDLTLENMMWMYLSAPVFAVLDRMAPHRFWPSLETYIASMEPCAENGLVPGSREQGSARCTSHSGRDCSTSLSDMIDRWNGRQAWAIAQELKIHGKYGCLEEKDRSVQCGKLEVLVDEIIDMFEQVDMEYLPSNRSLSRVASSARSIRTSSRRSTGARRDSSVRTIEVGTPTAGSTAETPMTSAETSRTASTSALRQSSTTVEKEATPINVIEVAEETPSNSRPLIVRAATSASTMSSTASNTPVSSPREAEIVVDTTPTPRTVAAEYIFDGVSGSGHLAKGDSTRLPSVVEGGGCVIDIASNSPADDTDAAPLAAVLQGNGSMESPRSRLTLEL